MARSKANRYPSALEMAEDLQAYLDNRVVRAYQTGAVAELRKWVVRNKGLAIAAATAVVLAVFGLLAVVAVEIRASHEQLLQSDIDVHYGLVEQAKNELWPAFPAQIPALEQWLARMNIVVGRLDEQRERLAELDPKDELGRKRLLLLVKELEGFQDPESGWIADVERRLQFARSLKKPIEDHRRAWDRAVASMADVGECPEYNGLEITPQLGLVPVGRDPESGHWEFAHLQTGVVPRRDDAGKLLIDATSGLIFVLVPGGTFRMGADKSSPPAADNVDPDADEVPAHDVTLAPFFISKYEMTQGQWLRFDRENPSRRDLGLLHPVENISREDCETTLWRLGLDLPTEAQWEYAARAGTSSRWWTGDAKSTIEGEGKVAGNVADEAYGGPRREDWNDGYKAHAPVGTFHPNRFGLHDTIGNVWEWVRENFGSYDDPWSGGEGERRYDGKFGGCRGGGFNVKARHCRSSNRFAFPGKNRDADLGIRPICPLR